MDLNKTFSVKYLVKSIVNPQYDGKIYEEVIITGVSLLYQALLIQ